MAKVEKRTTIHVDKIINDNVNSSKAGSRRNYCSDSEGVSGDSCAVVFRLRPAGGNVYLAASLWWIDVG